MIRRKIIFLLVAFLITIPVGAQEAQPLESDPVLEERVKAISYELRCLVCQNQTIGDSNAPLAVDLRNEVRDMLKRGMDENEIREFMVERYGDFVLYNPTVKGTTAFLWAGPLLMLLIAGWLAVRVVRRRSSDSLETTSNTDSDKAKSLLND